MLRTFARQGKRDVVAARLKPSANHEDLAPGDGPPTETKLAESLGVSLRELAHAPEFLEIILNRRSPRIAAPRRAEGPTIHASFKAIDDNRKASRNLQQCIDLDIQSQQALVKAHGVVLLKAFGDLLVA